MREKELQLLEEDIACDLKMARAALQRTGVPAYWCCLHRKEGLPAWSRSSRRAAPWPSPLSALQRFAMPDASAALPARGGTEARSGPPFAKQCQGAGDSCPPKFEDLRTAIESRGRAVRTLEREAGGLLALVARGGANTIIHGAEQLLAFILIEVSSKKDATQRATDAYVEAPVFAKDVNGLSAE